MKMLHFGQMSDLVPRAGLEDGLDLDSELPGITLKSLTIIETHDLFRSAAEVYLLGIAADSSGKIHIIPFGEEEMQAKSSELALQKVHRGETVEYTASGLALVLPPVSGFLILRLMVIDGDSKIRETAASIKSIAKIVASKEAIALLVATGMPLAAATAAVVGKAIEAAAEATEKNRDDIIGVFQGYFAANDMVPGSPILAKAGDARAEFDFVT